jgi:hypothetical protein
MLDRNPDRIAVQTLKRGSRRGAHRTTPIDTSAWTSKSVIKIDDFSPLVANTTAIVLLPPYSQGGNTPWMN